ncbi:tRNA pseudouridine(55) synthase TruB [Patescibacteria group bacterium]
MFLLIDKPKNTTSHDVVDQIRKITGVRKVGHAGTLDPNATGLLIVGVGRTSTKQLGDLTTKTKKTYIAEITLGEERDTDDTEGITSYKLQDTSYKPNVNKVKNTLEKFDGEQEQTPPAYSAIKLRGKKAYEMARRGESPELKPRKVTVYRANLLSYKYPRLEVEFEVSSGTYIRSLARDIGRSLKTYGYLSGLQRTKIGKYSLDQAVSLDHLNKNNWDNNTVEL